MFKLYFPEYVIPKSLNVGHGLSEYNIHYDNCINECIYNTKSKDRCHRMRELPWNAWIHECMIVHE